MITELSSTYAEVEPSQEDILYLLSSKVGLGHASRAVAIAQELEQNIIFATDQNVRPFLDANLKARGELNYIPLAYSPDMDEADFLVKNPDVLHSAEKTRIVINDFLRQVSYLRAGMNREFQDRKLIIGVYHSIDGYSINDPRGQAFQAMYMEAARTLDYLFLIEPRETHGDPYELTSGTVVIPCNPVIRKPTKDPDEVKQELGIDPEEEFILVQGGMEGNGEIRQVITQLSQLSLNGMRKVLAPYNMHIPDEYVIGSDIIIAHQRPDGHNLVNASAGVIAKPGMQITCEAIGARKPLLTVGDPNPERQLKLTMLQEILGRDIRFYLDVEQPLSAQIGEWLEHSPAIAQRFGTIACDGAGTIARALPGLEVAKIGVR